MVAELAATGKVNYMTGISLSDGTFRWGYSNLRDYGRPATLSAADINGDNRADIIATEPGTTGKVNYMTGISLGDGTFRWGYSNLRNWATPVAVATGDINGDARGDLVVAEPAAAGLMPLLLTETMV